MSKKRATRGLLAGMALATVICGSLPFSVNAGAAGQAGETAIVSDSSTRVADTVWFYKTENGKTYRRLFDATNQKWLTAWILC